MIPEASEILMNSTSTFYQMKNLQKLQDDLVRKYGGIKNGYISQEARQKAKRKRKKKKK